MRILHLVHQYPPEFTGGTELYTQTLAAAQVENGHRVAVFYPTTAPGPAKAPAMSTVGGIRLYRLPLGPRTRTRVFRDTFHQPELQSALALVLREEDPQLVHIQHLMGMPMGMAEQLQAADIPYVVTLHDYWFVCANAQLLTNTDHAICAGPNRLAVNCGRCALARAGRDNVLWLASGLAPLMLYRNRRLRAILERARKIIAPTRFVRRVYQDLGLPADKLLVLRHGIKPPPERAAAASLQKAAYDGSRPLRVAYLGSIAWQKGIHILIEAVNRLPEQSVQLTIYGDLASFPDYAGQLRAKTQDARTMLAGSLSRADLWQALDYFDLLVLPSLWYETSSLVLDEAFAAGLPVIASNIGVLAEKVEDGLNGRLFPPGDAAALSQVFLEIVSNPVLLERWRDGIPPVRTMADHVREIEALYQSTLDPV